LNVIPIEVPPLRERKEDIPFLVTHFLKKYDFVYKKEIVKIDKDALDILMAYHWPGNIRELENVIEYAVIRTKSEESITLCSLPEFIFDGKTTCGKKQSQSVSPAHLLQLLEENHWNKSKVARLLGINRTTLWRWMKESNLT
jgi:transcriptional regulator with PAS, ATPase and Fis domain